VHTTGKQSPANLRLSDFDFELPKELIAQFPAPRRTASRLMRVAESSVAHHRFSDLPALIAPGDLMVLNDTRVLKARLLGRKDSGGAVEALVERILSDTDALVQLRASKPPRSGARIDFDGGASAHVVAREGEFYRLRFEAGGAVSDVLERHGHLPLPPYIEHAAEARDIERYQTVYARRPGAVAAPTAGLHFDEALLTRLRARGVAFASLTLHVGAGTFQPVRADRIAEHRMHAERYEVPADTAAAVAAARAAGSRIVAVGTTSLRALESAADEAGTIRAGGGETRLFITPGYRFRVVDQLLTNFHLPRSTLLMLVCAFAGTGAIRNAYSVAIAERYRFFSYGDAMLLTRARGAAFADARAAADQGRQR
jgi:S-adenosylmethionine:tRNA ribosyltransferase-isomerase